MKWLIIFLFATILGVIVTIVMVLRDNERILKDKLAQKDFQIFALVTEYNQKRPGDSASIGPDGNAWISRKREFFPITIDPTIKDYLTIVDTIIVYDTLTMVIEEYRRGSAPAGARADTLYLNWRIEERGK